MLGRLTLRYALLAVAVVLLNFALPRALPGDPLGIEAESGLSAANPLPAAARAQLRASYGLDLPLPAQLGRSLRGLVHLDLGWSISRNAPVSQLIAERLPWTLALVLTATVLAALLGIGAGTWAAWFGGRRGQLVTSLVAALASLPEFLVAMGLLLLFAVGLHWLPAQGGRTSFAPHLPGLRGTLSAAGDVLAHLALPAATLVLAHGASFALLAHGAMSEARRQPYITAARGKGLSERTLALRHALPTVLLPLATLFGLRLGMVFGGAIVVERVFAIPGLGLLAFEAVRARDYPLMQGVFLLSSLALLATSFALEWLYAWRHRTLGEGVTP